MSTTQIIDDKLSDNLIKINGEYVKFYATTNSALPNIMRNTGAMIIYQDNSYVSYIRRSLYLANNFIASGYGLYDEEARNYIESISELTYDGRRVLTYELDNIRSNIDIVEETFQSYVKTYDGNISNTFIEIPNNGNPILVRTYDFAKMLKPAEYENISIHNFTACMTYELDEVNHDHNMFSFKNKRYKSIVTIDDETINKYSKNTQALFKVPKGCRISYLEFTCDADNGTTAGFIFNDNQRMSNNTQISYQLDIVENWHITEDSGDFVGSFSTNTFYTQGSLPYITWSNSGTYIYKPYPMLADTNYISYENVILPHVEYICKVSYVASQIVKHTFKNDLLTDVLNIYNDGWEFIDDNVSYINCDNDYTYLYISVPTNYDILKCNIKRQYERLGMSSYYIYNITGDIYELDCRTNIDENDLTYINMFVVNTTYTECRNYLIKYNFKTNDNIILYLNKINDNHIVNICNNRDYFNDNYINQHNGINLSSYFLQDSEFNSNHWFSPEELSYIQRN